MRKKYPFGVQRVVSRTAKAPGASVAVISNRGRQITRIKHREYLDVVLCPQAAFSYVVQPTNTLTFTWLPKVAQCYEMYRLISMSFSYENTIGTEAAGAVHMAYDYDVLDDVAPDAQSMSQFTTYLRTGLWKAARMVVDPRLANRIPWHYTATHGYPAVSDQKMYDIGRFWVLAIGSGAAVTAGEIYVDYEFEFCSPTVEVESLNTITFDPTPVTATTTFEQAVNPVVAVNAGQQLLEHVGRNNVSIQSAAGAVSRFVDIYKALHNFSGQIIAEGGVPLSAAARADFITDYFQHAVSVLGPFSQFHDDTDIIAQWRAPPVNHGGSASDAVAGQLGIGNLKMVKDHYYAFPWVNQSTGTNTGWSTPLAVGRNLKYYISERMPHLNYADPVSSSSTTTSSSSHEAPAPTILSADEEEEFVAVRKRR